MYISKPAFVFCMYIYIYRERERVRHREAVFHLEISLTVELGDSGDQQPASRDKSDKEIGFLRSCTALCPLCNSRSVSRGCCIPTIPNQSPDYHRACVRAGHPEGPCTLVPKSIPGSYHIALQESKSKELTKGGHAFWLPPRHKQALLWCCIRVVVLAGREPQSAGVVRGLRVTVEELQRILKDTFLTGQAPT